MTVNLAPVPGFGTGPTVATLSFDVGTQIGAGQGLHSEVFLSRDLQLDTQFAMKRIPKISFPHPTLYFAEARRLYDSRHANVVDVKYACEDSDYVYLAMPFYRGGSLQRLIDQRYLMTVEIVRYGIEFLSGLNHVHAKGLVHFDVKPSNILLDDSSTAALTDFGLSREVNAHGQVVMITAYRRHTPPEVLTNTTVTKQADIYQAGATLYRMCSGNAEFETQALQHNVDADPRAIGTGAFPDRRRFLDHIPRRLRRIICKALEPSPADRYTSALALANALGAIDESLQWQYQQGAAWGEGEWTESGTGRSRRVSLVQAGRTWQVLSILVSASGRERRFLKYCASGATEASAHRLAYEALTRPWH